MVQPQMTEEKENKLPKSTIKTISNFQLAQQII